MATRLISHREDIAGNTTSADFVEWNAIEKQLGKFLTFEAGGGCDFMTNAGNALSIGPRIPLRRRKQGSGNWGWIGNFDPKNHLITTERTPDFADSISFQISNPAFGLGANIEMDPTLTVEGQPKSFFAHIAAYDGGNRLIKDFRASAVANDMPGEAVFIGILNDDPDVARVKIWATLPSGALVDFAINRLEISYQP